MSRCQAEGHSEGAAVGKADFTGMMGGRMGRPRSPLNSAALRGCSGQRALIGALREAGLPQSAQPHWAAPFPQSGGHSCLSPTQGSWSQRAAAHQKRHPWLWSGHLSAKRMLTLHETRTFIRTLPCVCSRSVWGQGRARAALRARVLGMGTGCCPRKRSTRREDVGPWRSCNGPAGGIRADFLEEAVIGLSFEDRSGC